MLNVAVTKRHCADTAEAPIYQDIYRVMPVVDL